MRLANIAAGIKIAVAQVCKIIEGRIEYSIHAKIFALNNLQWKKDINPKNFVTVVLSSILIKKNIEDLFIAQNLIPSVKFLSVLNALYRTFINLLVL